MVSSSVAPTGPIATKADSRRYRRAPKEIAAAVEQAYHAGARAVAPPPARRSKGPRIRTSRAPGHGHGEVSDPDPAVPGSARWCPSSSASNWSSCARELR